MRFLAALCCVHKYWFQDGSALRRSARAIIVLMGLCAGAQAKPAQYPDVTSFAGDRYVSQAHMSSDVLNAIRAKSGAKSRNRHQREYASGRPAAWCGWWLGQHLGMPLRALWLARNWASVGSNAGGPGVGVIVVWPHHVGIITGRADKGWIIKSGNDGGAVRERARSVAGAIAYRNLYRSG